MPGDWGPKRYGMSRELRFEDRLMPALPQSPTIPSSRFAESDKFKSGLDRPDLSQGTDAPKK
jgi:hypothetical protein